MNRTEAAYYKNQDEDFIRSRDKVRRYIYMSHLIPNKSTYVKVMGQRFNGVRNGPLSFRDVEILNSGIDRIKDLLEEFKTELNK